MTLLTPMALVGLLTLPLLVVFYLFRPEPRQQASTTYFLWKAAAPDSQGGRFANRLRNNPLLWLQLLFLAAVVFFLARPSMPWTSRLPESAKVVIVVDRSASMQAGGAFEQAKQEALEAVDSLLGFRVAGSTPEVMLMAVDSEPHVLVPFTKDPSLLQRALEDLTPTDRADRLESMAPIFLSLIKSQRAKIWLFGDRLPQNLELGGLQFSSTAQGEHDNAGLLSFSVQAPDRSKGLHKPFLYTRVENFSSHAQQRTLRLEKMETEDPETVEALVLEKNLLLASHSGQTLVEAIPALRFEADQNSLFRLTLAPVPGQERDLFAPDDQAYCVVPSFQSERVLVGVSEAVKSSFLLRAIAASQGIKVMAVKDLLALDPVPTVDLLLHPSGAPIPKQLKARSVFTVAPPPSKQEGRVVRLKAADKAAPLLVNSGMEWTRQKVELTDTSELASDETVLLESSQGPALTLSGLSKGQPTLHWRFPLAYSSLPLSPALPVLVGRFIDQYSRSAGSPTSGSYSTESVFLRPNGQVWTGVLRLEALAGPGSEYGITLETAESSKVVKTPTHTGLYTLSSRETAEPFAVGLYSFQESTLQRRNEDANFPVEPGEELQQEDSPDGTIVYRSVGLPLLVLALLLLLLEAALFLKRGRP